MNNKIHQKIFRWCVAIAVSIEAVSTYIITAQNHWIWVDRIVAGILASGLVGIMTWVIGTVTGKVVKFLFRKGEEVARIVGAIVVIIAIEIIPIILSLLKGCI